MAKPQWLIINPASGSGNGSIANSAAAHTGRVAREGDVTVQGAGVAHSLQFIMLLRKQKPSSQVLTMVLKWLLPLLAVT